MEMVVHHRSKWFDLLLVVAGTTMMAVGVNMVYDPMGMVTGGVSGVAIVVKELTHGVMGDGIPIWLTNTLLNVPIFLGALLLVGKRFVLRTLFGALSFSVALYLVPSYNLCGDDYLLASIFGAVISGVGIGMVFMTHSSTGGTDMFCMTIHRFLRHYTVPQMLMVVDGAIVLAGAAVFGLRAALYAVIAVYITSKVSDAMLEGLKFAKMVYIISERYEQIAEEIMTKMDRGATGIPIRGMYTGADRNMLFCVVNNKEIVQIKEIVTELDPKAFVIVSDVREAVGEGFVEYRQEKPAKL